MSKTYGEGAPLSYNKYLRVAELIGLQECLSDPAHHDELLFITIHQTYELWFKQVLHEIDAACRQLVEDRAFAATRSLTRVVEIEKVLVNQIHVLETMTPISFLGFRDQLNPASGFQSMQFREIEFASGLKDEGLLTNFGDDVFASERLRARLDALHEERHLWCGVDPAAARVLDAIQAAGLRTAAISNTEDGRLEELMRLVGLADRFDFMLDSFAVGVRKPDPAIFRLALERLGLRPRDAFYVGDSYGHDALPALALGLGAVLVDPLGLHPESVCPRVRSLGELAEADGAARV